MRVVLASSSKQRQDILNMIGLNYEVITSDVEEFSKEIKPDKYVEELSLNKANSVKKQMNGEGIIIAADTIVYFNGKFYEKPKTKEEAYNNILELSGNKNTVYTGMTLIDLYQNKTITISSSVDVYFKEVEKPEIEWYVNNEEKLFKCCGYTPLGKASIFIDKVEGDYNTLIGISPKVVFDTLKSLGYKITDFEFKGNTINK